MEKQSFNLFKVNSGTLSFFIFSVKVNNTGTYRYYSMHGNGDAIVVERISNIAQLLSDSDGVIEEIPFGSDEYASAISSLNKFVRDEISIINQPTVRVLKNDDIILKNSSFVSGQIPEHELFVDKKRALFSDLRRDDLSYIMEKKKSIY
jgi:hypothetical protein